MTASKYRSIEIIFDRDHGLVNYGWYVRTIDQDGQHEDTTISEDWSEDPEAADATILTWAMSYFCDPDGMTDAELQDLRDIIEVSR